MEPWRKCTSCKTGIGFEKAYWVCNVSTCQKKRAGLVFCSVTCWDAHLPVLRHKEAWAIESKSPSVKVWGEVLAGTRDDPTYPARERPKAEAVEVVAPTRVASSTPVVIRRRSS